MKRKLEDGSTCGELVVKKQKVIHTLNNNNNNNTTSIRSIYPLFPDYNLYLSLLLCIEECQIIENLSIPSIICRTIAEYSNGYIIKCNRCNKKQHVLPIKLLLWFGLYDGRCFCRKCIDSTTTNCCIQFQTKVL